MGLGKVQARGQVTVPARVRKALGIEPGDTLMFEVVGDQECRVLVIKGTRAMDALLQRYPSDQPMPEVLWEQMQEDIANDTVDATSP